MSRRVCSAAVLKIEGWRRVEKSEEELQCSKKGLGGSTDALTRIGVVFFQNWAARLRNGAYFTLDYTHLSSYCSHYLKLRYAKVCTEFLLMARVSVLGTRQVRESFGCTCPLSLTCSTTEFRIE